MVRFALAAAVTLASAASHAQSFEAACDALGPAADVQVSYASAAAQIDDSKAARDIKTDPKRDNSFRHLGVTRATLLRDVDIRLGGFTDERTGRACAWPKITLRLTVRPLLIELARELGASQCMRNHVFEHEMQHVAIYNAAVLRAASTLKQEMRAYFNERQLLGDESNLMREVQSQVNERWLPRLDALIVESEPEHDALDAAEEGQAYVVCSGALSQLVKAIE